MNSSRYALSPSRRNGFVETKKKGISHPWPSIISNEQVTVWAEKFKEDYPGNNKPITRKQLAVFINSLAQHPFDEAINLNGEISNRTK